MLLGVPEFLLFFFFFFFFFWLVYMEVNGYISNDVQNYEKLILSLALWLGSMSAV